MNLLKSPKALIMTLVMAGIFAVMLLMASQWDEEARFMPFVVGIPALGLCILQLFLDISRKTPGKPEGQPQASELQEAEERISRMTGREMHFDVAHDASIPVEERPDEGAARKREIIVWIAFPALLLSVVLFGFSISVPVFLFVFLYFITGLRVVLALLAAVLATAFVLVLFEIVLQNELHRGILTPWLRGLVFG